MLKFYHHPLFKHCVCHPYRWLNKTVVAEVITRLHISNSYHSASHRHVPNLVSAVKVKCVSSSPLVSEHDNSIIELLDKVSIIRSSSLEIDSTIPKPIFKTKQEELLAEALGNRNVQVVPDWSILTHEVLSAGTKINPRNVEAVIMGMCITFINVQAGASYLKHLLLTKKVNVATLGKFLKLCYVTHKDTSLSDEMEKVISFVYDKLMSMCPMLDSYTAENAVPSLALTNRWKEGVELLKTVSLTCVPSRALYNVLAKSAFDHNDSQVGWSLLHEMIQVGRHPSSDVYIAWLNYSDRANIKKREELLNHLLMFFVKNDLRPTREVTEGLKKRFELSSDNNRHWCGNFTMVSKSGICKSCQNHLPSIKLTETEFEELRSAFIHQVIIGSNVFLKTSPSEITKFKDFVYKHAPFDVVLDGLNVAYCAGSTKSTPYNYSRMLHSVVQHFVNKSQRVLVLGRKHMKNWPKVHMDYIYKNAKVFLAENVSQDDPLLLYAAMYSGLETTFLSRDLMRSHIFLLSNSTLKSYFKRWQQQHQYKLMHVEDNGSVHLKPPLTYNPDVQSNTDGTAWHIPYSSSDAVNGAQSLEPPLDWLCLKCTTNNH